MTTPASTPSRILLAGLIWTVASVCQADMDGRQTDLLTATAPNILLVLLDDFGYGDLGANGPSAQVTPNLDQIAKQGVLFTRHYTDSTCSPTRVALLTGRYPARAGFRPNGRGLSKEEHTLPEALREAGYSTTHIGKWHIGLEPAAAHPDAQGFDYWFGFLDQLHLSGPDQAGLLRFRRPTYRDPWLIGNDGSARRHSGHLTDILTKQTVNAILASADQSDPWFINLWYYAPHSPIQPAGRYLARHEPTLSGRYQAMIEQLDDNIGQLMAALELSGQSDNTLVIVASDNGGTNKGGDNNTPFAGSKNSYMEGGIRTPLMMRWPGRLAAGRRVDAVVSIMDLYPTLAELSGAPPSHDLDGRTLTPLLSPPRRPHAPDPRPLYWEQYVFGEYVYSVLSADGRWRLIRHYEDGARLFDLATDPTGATDVAPDHPDRVLAMDAAYQAWHRAMRHVPVSRAITDTGNTVLRGQDFQRTPGFGGFTIALEVWMPTPSPDAGDQLITGQPGLWSLTHHPSRGLQARMGDMLLAGPPLTSGRCHALALSGYYHVANLRPKNNAAFFNLYVDGISVDNESSRTLLPLDVVDEDTRLGSAMASFDAFDGHIGRVILLNERLAPDGGPTRPGIDSLGAGLCIPTTETPQPAIVNDHSLEDL